ncbi:hypothetical protein C8R44DRAFT_948503 [Mycena epipterygia]|nr:hypothetical protein C8R44DRAFT_948503 [Mycena epipterygia]
MFVPLLSDSRRSWSSRLPGRASSSGESGGGESEGGESEGGESGGSESSSGGEGEGSESSSSGEGEGSESSGGESGGSSHCVPTGPNHTGPSNTYLNLVFHSAARLSDNSAAYINQWGCNVGYFGNIIHIVAGVLLPPGLAQHGTRPCGNKYSRMRNDLEDNRVWLWRALASGYSTRQTYTELCSGLPTQAVVRRGRNAVSSGKSGTSSSSSNEGGSSTSEGPSGVISSGGSSRTITSFGNGGGKVTTIASSNLFSGRSEGGATRSQIYGSQAYGSGYPGVNSRGVDGRGFPFYFWPLSWGTGPNYGPNATYLHTDEYYRASSVALSLDGYNDIAVFAPENSTANTPLPAGIDMTLLGCLNGTIGNAVPLVDGARTHAAPSVGVLVLVLLLRALL